MESHDQGTFRFDARILGGINDDNGLCCIRTRLTEIQQSDWSVALAQNEIDHVVEDHVLKTTVDDLERSPLSFRHLEMF